MPSRSDKDEIFRIVGRYIRQVAPGALATYLDETGLIEQNLERDLPDLRSIIESYQSNQIASSFTSLSLKPSENVSSTNESIKEVLKLKIPEAFRLDQVEKTIEGVSTGNLLGVWVDDVPKRRFETRSASYRSTYERKIIVTSVDKTLKIVDPESGEVDLILQPHKAAILTVSIHPVWKRYILTGSMDGTAVLTDLITNQPIQTFPHKKFVNLTAFSPRSTGGRYMVTAGHDRVINVYQIDTPHSSLNEDDLDLLDEEDKEELAGPPSLRYKKVWTVDTETNPEGIVFTETHLVYTLRSSCYLYFVTLPGRNGPGGKAQEWTTRTKSFNPSPLDTHVSFSVLYLALHPGGKLIACITGDPATTGGGERVLIYSTEVEEDVDMTRGEEGERLKCLWTGEVGDEYVLPRLTWLPDGSGLITTTTSGHLNLIELSTGTAKSKFKAHGGIVNGNETSGIVRDVVSFGESELPDTWRVISVGYDGRIQISR